MNNQVKKISIGNEDFREKTTTTKQKKKTKQNFHSYMEKKSMLT